jgi:DNA repair protein RecO (recombination protein O)
MKFTDIGTILSLEHKQEGLLLLKILSSNNGICSGIVKRPSKKSLPNYQIGNIVKFERFARLADQLGTLSCEPIKSYQAQIISKKSSLYAFKSLSLILLSSFMEYQNHTRIHDELLIFLDKINDYSWRDYCIFELEILKDAGYELDFRNCAGCGIDTNLIYISPKSGRSVCKNCSVGYENLLLELPSSVFNPKAEISSSDAIKLLDLSEYFFKRYIWRESNIDEICFYRNGLKKLIIPNTISK